jgi:hypothetical protein
MEVQFDLLIISSYGWYGFSFFSFETTEDVYPLLCVDHQQGRTIIAFLFIFKIVIH